ncbi:MAG: pitrilysin family protein [Candidatus Gracilibacteria bacterium]|nr:pitrilysin family protein [Candidatus Gracilibacteria bacterium]
MKSFQQTTLDNGLRIATSTIPSDSITLLVLVGAGSRYEELEISGISHFIEHMFFKGASRFQNTKEVSEAIDGVGGQFNAFTGKEYAGYYVKLAKENKHVAFDVVSDMLINPKFDPAEIDKERGVIMEELNMYQDTPMYQIGWDFEKLMFGDQPMGRDQIGTKTLINSVTQEQFQKYHDELYSTDNTVIAVSGNIEHEEILQLVDKYFQFNITEKKRTWAKFEGYNKDTKVIIQKKKTEQAHLCIGFPGYHTGHDDFYAEKLMSIALGGNMSSRMFLNVREAQGLCYYIHSTVDDYTDCGHFSTNAGVDVNRIDQAVTSIINEYKQLLENPITEKELIKSKSYLYGKLVIGLEDSQEVAHLLGKQVLLGEGVKTLEDLKKKIDAVTVEDIARVAQDIIKPEMMKLAYIGPERTEESFLEHMVF